MTWALRTRVSERFGENTPVVGTVITSTFLIGFGGGVVFPILPNLGTILDISPLMVAIILSANRATRLVVSAPAGALVDRLGTRLPFVVGMGVQTIGTAGYVLAFYLPVPTVWFISARVTWGIGSAFVFATALTIAADVSTGDSRGASMGIIRGGVLFGFPTGVALGGLVSEYAGNVAAFGLATAFAAVATVVAYRLIPETHVTGDTHRSIKPWDIDTSLSALTVGGVNFVVLFIYVGALFSTLVVFLDQKGLSVFGLGPQGSSGVFMAITVVAAALFTILGGSLSDRRESRMPTLLVFLGLAGGGFFLLVAVESVLVLAVACVFIGVGQGGMSGPLLALLADLTPNEQMGRAVGTNNVFGDIGGSLGPLVTLPLVDRIGFDPVYLACGLLPFAAAVALTVGVYAETGRLLPSQTAADSVARREQPSDSGTER
ncbi:MAG: arabinose efflux permease [halophilic archaeon J07HX5]|nr:MAG: arabinose efflux permease [halophilic archaeon J07HX5]